jgi:hypothetical protein
MQNILPSRYAFSNKSKKYILSFILYYVSFQTGV